MNANFCHSEVCTKKKAPWLEACCSVKATLQTYSNMANHHCSKETFKLHLQPLRGKNKSSKRTEGKRALCADAVPDGVSKAVGGSGRTQHPLLPGARGFASLGGHLPACGSEHWDFQLPSVIHVAALASGTWKWDIPTVFRTSEVCTYSSAPHILFFFFPFLFSPVSIKFWGQKHPVLVLTRLTTDTALHSSTPLMSCLCQRGLIV